LIKLNLFDEVREERHPKKDVFMYSIKVDN